MKVTVPEISFHNRDPVLSVDIQPKSPDDVIRMATGGTDTHVLVWQLNPLPSGGVGVEVLCDLARHNRAVNAVRFSPDGALLASADDEAAIIVWKKQEVCSGGAPDLFASDGEERNKETWIIYKMLRGHIEDVYDLSWSSCSNFLVSGSIDNSAIMWDVHKGKNTGLLKEHKNFVQGVAWDPLGQFVATLSSDRVLRWFSVSTKRAVHRASKAELPVVLSSGQMSTVNTRLFYDDTLKSFCRRLTFSPDGLLLAAPAGILEGEQLGSRFLHAVHIFTRMSPTKPVLYLPTRDKYSVAVRFCPLLFKLRPGREGSQYKGQSLFALPYRMVFAVACQNSLVLYDTQQLMPFAIVSNMHITRLTDLAWSSDGRILVISSTDGYCSVTYFSEGELGDVYIETSSSAAAACTPLKPTGNSDLPSSNPQVVRPKPASGDLKTEESPKKKTDLEAESHKENIPDVTEPAATGSEKVQPSNETSGGTARPETKVNILIPKKSEKRILSSSADAQSPGTKSSSVSSVAPHNSGPTVVKDAEEEDIAESSEENDDEEEEEVEQNDDEEEEEAEELNSDGSESLGSRDSEMEEDDDEGDVSLMSCDSDDDDNKFNSYDEDMGVTKIVHEDEVKRDSGSKSSQANTFRNNRNQSAPKNASRAPTSAMARPSDSARSVNIIHVKHKPGGSSVKPSSVSSTPSPGTRCSASKPPRRVALVTLPRPSPAVPVQAAPPSPAAANCIAESLEMLSDNTSDLCLKLEDEATVCNTADGPTDDTVKAPKVDLHSALVSGCEKESAKETPGTNIQVKGDTSLSCNKSTSLKSVSSSHSGKRKSCTSTMTPSKDLGKNNPQASANEKESSASTSKADESENLTAGASVGTPARPSTEVFRCTPKSAPRTPRRVSLITLSSPKAKKCLNADRNKPV